MVELSVNKAIHQEHFSKFTENVCNVRTVTGKHLIGTEKIIHNFTHTLQEHILKILI